jgi:hypothetical protein
MGYIGYKTSLGYILRPSLKKQKSILLISDFN